MYLINGSFFVIAGVISYLLIWGLMTKPSKQKPMNWFSELTKFLFVLYCLLVVSVTLFPLPIGFPFTFENLSAFINLIPLVSIWKQISLIGTAYDGDVLFMIGLIIRNVGGNILLFVPLGFLIPIIWKNVRYLKQIFFIGIGISVTIELLQLLESFVGGWGRVTDIDDVICNVFGSVLGYLLYDLLLLFSKKYQVRILHRIYKV
ncbi:VanZ family protein [Fictibacillus phosphorivorans]|uniref:VanZ family protein n=1 Tax=Fictibacillus phosphorivorans TaxID=1221500 RepID=UPI0012BF3CAF|nr:VanZ family protein [Fictibacillus phosphorivorans]MQR94367.1 VanZ family protein [Fictibacillus phosphorivorans]